MKSANKKKCYLFNPGGIFLNFLQVLFIRATTEIVQPMEQYAGNSHLNNCFRYIYYIVPIYLFRI